MVSRIGDYAYYAQLIRHVIHRLLGGTFVLLNRLIPDGKASQRVLVLADATGQYIFSWSM